METSRITTKGQITLPASIRKRFGLAAGNTVMFASTDQGILVKPVEIIDKTQTPAWKKNLDAALADVAAGRVTFHEDAESFISDLEKLGGVRRPKKRLVPKK